MKYLRKVLTIACTLVVTVCTFVGCGSGDLKKVDATNNIQVEEVVAIEGTPIATMDIKDYGQVTLELYPEMAPNTVNNFITLANEGFYDGLTFHRVIEGFMIQGGEPEGQGTGGPGYSITGEFKENGYETNELPHTTGVISMARAYDPNSAGSQFFIMVEDAPHLDGKYAAFGKVIEGLDIIEAIQYVETNSNDKPINGVIIESIRVDIQGSSVPAVVKINQ